MDSSSQSKLLTEIENSSETTSKVTIWSLSGAGFVIRSSDAILYIDAWLVPPDPARTTRRTFPIPFSPESVNKATAILSTHEHEDHCNVPTLIGLNKNTKAPLIGPDSVVQKALKGGFPPSSISKVSDGDVIDLSEFRVKVFKANDPYEESAVMYLIQTPRANIFHSGDSSYFDRFKEIGDTEDVDVALLNFGKQIPSPEKPYYMNSEKLSLAARDLRASIVIPMHWNLWVETREDPQQIKQVLSSVAPSSKLVILEGGQKLEI